MPLIVSAEPAGLGAPPTSALVVLEITVDAMLASMVRNPLIPFSIYEIAGAAAVIVIAALITVLVIALVLRRKSRGK